MITVSYRDKISKILHHNYMRPKNRILFYILSMLSFCVFLSLFLVQCPSKTFGSFESTKGFPDNVIQFARHHPLMYNPVTPLGGRPMFLRTGIPYSFTQIAVDRVNAADGHYDVMFIGTGQR